MTLEQLLTAPCKHGNRPTLVEVEPRELWRAQCQPCRCGHRTQPSRAPIWAASKWHRSHHWFANAGLDLQEDAR
jgi:hypothetical protein